MVISEDFKSEIVSVFYKNRHIILYTFFGAVSISLELICRRLLLSVTVNNGIATVAPVVLGILTAFILNVWLNFSIPQRKLYKALFYFFVISVGSISLQHFLRYQFDIYVDSYEVSRVLIAGSVFILAYLLHRRLSFRDSRLVGVAIYANGVEDIAGIRKKIGSYPDFIHVDIVDKTVNEGIDDVRPYRLEAIRAYWPKQEIHTHIMSRQPSKWIPEVGPFSDVIYVHDRIDEDLSEVKNQIVKMGARPGLALHAIDGCQHLETVLHGEQDVLVLSIEKPGQSGQRFLEKAFAMIRCINALPFRNSIRLCVDGGVTDENIIRIESDLIVSGSNVLCSPDPKQQIMRLQTLNQSIYRPIRRTIGNEPASSER